MTISAELLFHYRNAHYLVRYQGCSIAFHVAEQNTALAQLLREQGANSGLFITAFNPYSQLLSDVENAARDALLEQRLNHLNKRYFSGYGKSNEIAINNNNTPQRKWPKEISHLVLNIKKEDAQEWLQEFAQNAAIYVEKNGNCSLILNQLQQ